MKKQIAEYMKMVNAIGPVSGTRIFLKKNFSGNKMQVKLPGYNRPVSVRKNSSDWNVFKQVFIWKEYEYPFFFQPSTILDAGANVGYAAVWFANKFPEARIVSLEPESGNFNQLKENTKDYKNIEAVKAGLWSRSCYLRIINPDWGSWGFRTEETDQGGDGAIPAVSIGDIMQQRGWDSIDLLKIDIESAEWKVFGENYENWLPKAKMIFLELHDNINRQSSKSVFSALLKYDFSIDISGENIVAINNAFKK